MKTLLSVCLTLPLAGFAATLPHDEPIPLPEWVVVGTRTLLPVDQQAPSIGLLSPESLLQAQVVGVADALAGIPGLHAVTSGQDGALVSLFTRGTNSSHTTLLFEGRRLPAGFSGNYGLSALELDPGMGVEVARGPGSFLFGADAIGGVINLGGGRTAVGESGSAGVAEVFAGSFGSVGGRWSAGMREGAWSGEVGGSVRQTDNDEPNSAARRRQGRVALRFNEGNGWSGDLQVLGWSSALGLPDNRKAEGYPKLTDYQRERGYLVSPGLRWEQAGTRVSTFVTRAEDRLEARNTFFFGGTSFPAEDLYRTESHAVEVQVDHHADNGWIWSAGALASALDFRSEDLLFGGAVVDESTHTAGAWGQVQATLTDDFGVAAGLRLDDYGDFDTPWTGSLQAAWKLGEAHRVFARIGTAYAAPKAFDLYGLFGNPTLDAERSRSYEVGVRTRWGNGNGVGRAEATVFHQPIRDLIVFDPVTFSTANIGRARTEGLELSLEQGWAGVWTAYGHYTYLTAENRTEGNRLLRRPRHTVLAGLRWSQSGLSLAAEVRHVAGREDIDGGTYARIDAPDYTVARLLGSWEFADGWTVFGRIENLFDERYDEVDGYAALPRGYHIGLRWRW